MQVNPNEKIQLAALVGDTTDATVYYVQAVMRDTMANTVLGTVNLTRDSVNGRRFYGFIQAPSNNTPTGRFIDITITFYTNAGYTVKAANLPETINTYIVAQRWNYALDGDGTGDPFSSFSSNVSEMMDKRFRMLMPLFAEFGKVHKALKSLPSALIPEDDTGAEDGEKSIHKGISEALRAVMKEHDNSKMIGEIKLLSEAMHALLKGSEGSNEESRKAAREASAKISQAAETIIASYMYHSVKELPVVSRSPAPEEGSMEEALSEKTDENTGRRPSDGVVPIHIIHRNHRAMSEGSVLP